MNRKIQWIDGYYDGIEMEVEPIYDKASKNENIARLLSELETGAVAEARTLSDSVKIDGQSITPQQFDALPARSKEQVMSALSTVGLATFNPIFEEPKIIVRLTPDIQLVRCCTAFSILNRLEKLDGAINNLYPTVTLELQVPLGRNKGMDKLACLIVLLYPWLQVSQVFYQ